MNKLLRYALACVTSVASFGMSASDVAHVMYGVRVYDTEHGETHSLVSVSLDNLSTVNEVYTFNDFLVLAAACDGEHYYMLTSLDGIVPYNLYSYDLATKKLTSIA
jgi:hypothetical protein